MNTKKSCQKGSLLHVYLITFPLLGQQTRYKKVSYEMCVVKQLCNCRQKAYQKLNLLQEIPKILF